MEPKFQSSFIPKGPASTTMSMGASVGARPKRRDLISLLSVLLFSASLILAVGVFAYKFYLGYRIESMSAQIESARTSLAPEVVGELTRLHGRIVSVQDLLSKHLALTPLFAYLEESTPGPVRFTDLSYSNDSDGPAITLGGEATGYEVLASLAEEFNKDKRFQDPVFSDLRLDDRGNVIFTMTASIDPELLSYHNLVETAVITQPVAPASTSTATTTQAAN